MSKEKKKILEQVKKLNCENYELFTRKAELEKEILEVDIELNEVCVEYGNLISKLLLKK